MKKYKPRTQDGINYKLTGLVIQVLTPIDKIKVGDFIRPYYEEPMLSQDGGWDTTYRNDNWRGSMWHKVQDDIPYWVGKTYKEYFKFSKLAVIEDEIVRVIDIA